MLCGCLTFGCVASTPGPEAEKDSAFYVKMAQAYMSEGRFQLASVELHKALQQETRQCQCPEQSRHCASAVSGVRSCD